MMGYRTVATSESLFFGTLFHAGLEAWWNAKENRLSAALEAMDVDAESGVKAMANALMIGYEARWGAEPLTALDVESIYTADLINPESGRPSRTYQQAGKLDVIAKNTDTGRIYVIEHKTSSEDIGMGTTYWKRLRMDGQISNYMRGARYLGYEVEGCIYDVIRKPQLRLRRATPEDKRKYLAGTRTLYKNQRENDESGEEYENRILDDIASDPDKYYQRGDVVRLETEETEAELDLYMTSKMIRESEKTNRWPRNPAACMDWSRECDFFDVCTGCGSLEDHSQFVKKENMHQELNK